MNRSTLGSTLVWVFLVTALGGAHEVAAQVSGLEVDPTSPCIHQGAVFKVLGRGACMGSLSFGDGTPAAAFDALPFSVTHTYTTVGAYTATVTTDNCGTASLDLDTQFCRPTAGRATKHTIRPQRKAVAIPTIEGVITFGIEPGGAVLIAGKLFGEAPGRVRILGVSGERNLELDSWSSGAVQGRVPADVVPICPTGDLIVETAAGGSSRPWRVQVPLETKKLPATDVQVVSCGTDGNENRCNNTGDDGDLCVSVLFPPWFVGLDREGKLLGEPSPAAVGIHSNCWGAVGDDSGTDTYRIALKNGWVLDSAQFLSSVPDGEGSTTPPSGTLPAGFVQGASSWQPAIGWSVTPNDAVIYNLYVTIRGPACASHK
ncbi:MAG: PKD domain-containing protein [Acidobacteria bacterium]|nr:PKD domain-containing protein [Acidobacteriota bacterium]